MPAWYSVTLEDEQPAETLNCVDFNKENQELLSRLHGDDTGSLPKDSPKFLPPPGLPPPPKMQEAEDSFLPKGQERTSALLNDISSELTRVAEKFMADSRINIATGAPTGAPLAKQVLPEHMTWQMLQAINDSVFATSTISKSHECPSIMSPAEYESLYMALHSQNRRHCTV